MNEIIVDSCSYRRRNTTVCIYIICDSSFNEDDVTDFAFGGKITFMWQEVKY